MTAEAHGFRARPLREGERRCLGLRTGLQAEGGSRGLEAKPARTVPPGLHRWDRLSLRRGDRVGHPSLGPRRCEAPRAPAAKAPHSPTSLGVACTLTGEKTCKSLRFLLRNVKTLSNRPLQSMRYCEWEPLVANVRYWHREPSIFRKGAACCYLRLAMSESRRRRFSAWRIESGPRTS